MERDQWYEMGQRLFLIYIFNLFPVYFITFRCSVGIRIKGNIDLVRVELVAVVWNKTYYKH